MATRLGVVVVLLGQHDDQLKIKLIRIGSPNLVNWIHIIERVLNSYVGGLVNGLEGPRYEELIMHIC